MDKVCDLAIIGGGPAGLSAAIYAGRADLRTTVLEKMIVGGQVALTMDIANYPGFPEGVDGPTLSAKMKAQAERFGVEFLTAEATDISKNGKSFTITHKNGMIEAKAVIISTGSDPRKLGVPGEKELRGRGVSYCGTCDAPFFRERKVVVVGGGDSALKESLHIAKFASEITLVHRRDTFRGEKIYQRQVMSNERINIRWNTSVKSINGTDKLTSVTVENSDGEVEEIKADGIFIFVGTVPNTELICHLVPKNCGGHIDTDMDMMTAVEGLFAVGDVREHSYRQVATAVGEGATAAMAAGHYIENLE
ncbi:MAG: thioredoxin-disulfide reductase [Planctomycetes bacterium]|nr:thioredoxin-disulfide reductase [Planctomycetota bacterium]